MSVSTTFYQQLEDLLTPTNRHHNKAAQYGQAARFTGLAARRIKGLVTGEVKDPKLSDVDAVNKGWLKFIKEQAAKHNSSMWDRIERMRIEAEAAGYDG